jgi:nitroreductase
MGGGTPTRTSGSSIYPAVQNMLLTARALGLGATLTTLYLTFEKKVEAALPLGGENKVVEVDETYVGGKEANKHKSRRQHRGRGPVGKEPS